MGRRFIPCLYCAKPFKSVRDLKQHQEDVYHFVGPYGDKWSKKDLLFKYLEALYEHRVMVLRNDQKISRKIVRGKLQEINKELKNYGSELNSYSFKVETAGSTATSTKVFAADEFDFNITIDSNCIELSRKPTNIAFKQDRSNYSQSLARPSQYQFSRQGICPPNGYVSVKYKRNSECYNVNWAFEDYLIPRKVQEDFYKRITEALENIPGDIKISSFAHGPAIVVKIEKPTLTEKHHTTQVTHDISIDFSAAFNTNITPRAYQWPRDETYDCLSEEKIELVKNTKLCLVPKHNFFWYVSFSRPAKALMRCIDSANTCRRRCHRLLKSDFLKWRSEASYEGISTFIFKNHLFWFNEELDLSGDDLDEYWHFSNIGNCYIDMLEDFAEKLEEGCLWNYFHQSVNLLDNKDDDVLERLAERIRKRIGQLKSIYVYYE